MLLTGNNLHSVISGAGDKPTMIITNTHTLQTHFIHTDTHTFLNVSALNRMNILKWSIYLAHQQMPHTKINTHNSLIYAALVILL